MTSNEGAPVTSLSAFAQAHLYYTVALSKQIGANTAISLYCLDLVLIHFPFAGMIFTVDRRDSTFSEVDRFLRSRTTHDTTELPDSLVSEVLAVDTSSLERELHSTILANLSLTTADDMLRSGPVVDYLQLHFLRHYSRSHANSSNLAVLTELSPLFVNACVERYHDCRHKLRYCHAIARMCGLTGEHEGVQIASHQQGLVFPPDGILPNKRNRFVVTYISYESPVQAQIEAIENAVSISDRDIVLLLFTGKELNASCTIPAKCRKGMKHVPISPSLVLYHLIRGTSDHPLKQYVSQQLPLRVLSPYNTLGPVGSSTFVGRRDEVREVTTSYRQHMCVLGPRRIGKTSLLKHIEQQVNRGHAIPGTIAIDVDATDITTEEQLIDNIYCQSLAFAGAGLQCDDELWRSKGLGGVALQFLRWRQAGRSVILLIDEIDGFLKDGKCSLEMEQFLRKIANTTDCRVVLFGFDILAERVRDRGSALFNLLQEIVLGPVKLPAATELIVEPMSRIGVAVSDGVATHIATECAFIPWLIQAVCHEILLSEQVDARREVRMEDAKAAYRSRSITKEMIKSISDPKSFNCIKRIVIYTVANLGPGSVGAEKVVEAICDSAASIGYAEVRDALDFLEETYFLRHSASGYSFYVPDTGVRLKQAQGDPNASFDLSSVIDRLVREYRRSQRSGGGLR